MLTFKTFDLYTDWLEGGEVPDGLQNHPVGSIAFLIRTLLTYLFFEAINRKTLLFDTSCQYFLTHSVAWKSAEDAPWTIRSPSTRVRAQAGPKGEEIGKYKKIA